MNEGFLINIVFWLQVQIEYPSAEEFPRVVGKRSMKKVVVHNNYSYKIVAFLRVHLQFLLACI